MNELFFLLSYHVLVDGAGESGNGDECCLKFSF